MIAWIDLETTGLHEDNSSILEVGIVVTDDQLNEVDSKSVLVKPIFGTLEQADSVVLAMHTKNGLFDAVEKNGIRRYEAEQLLIDWITPILGDQVGKVPLAGATIGFDRVFLRDHMPRLYTLFHYRSIDVTGFHMVMERFCKKLRRDCPRPLDKAHRSLADIRDSIGQLKFYCNNLFVVED